MRIGITRFLGTNCDEDVRKWILSIGHTAQYLWYEDRFNTVDYDAVIIPGGFSHGDYLRCGALAARTPVMKSVIEFAQTGKPVLGICNGFQILCESGLLSGVLLQNEKLKFKDEWVQLKIENQNNYFAKTLKKGQQVKLPIAHGEGRFYVDDAGLKSLQDNEQIWLKYSTNNPNGSLLDIAGIVNKSKNVCGLMPHPERALYGWMGSVDGMLFL
jgi:phosphoribosylformylglycinamidine synthase subunit PurQ / glutaminase